MTTAEKKQFKNGLVIGGTVAATIMFVVAFYLFRKK
jgi:hypothetical protein